jgi:hypothetical protein
MSIVMKALMSMGMKLLTEKFLEEIIVWGMKKLAASTKTKIDDELAETVARHLGR